MTGYRPGIYWQMTWRYIGPAIMAVILVSSVISMIVKNPTYGAWDAVLVSALELFLIEFFVINIYCVCSSRELQLKQHIHHGSWQFQWP